jgi:hypothetical protein
LKKTSYKTKHPNKPWYTQPESEKLNKGICLRLRKDEYAELSRLIVEKEKMSVTEFARTVMRKQLVRLRKKHES